MRSCWIVLLIFIVGSISHCQSHDTVTIRHKFYATTFNTSLRFPIVVKYWLTKKMQDCGKKSKRTDKFTPDPQLPEFTDLKKDYYKSGYDEGHNMDAFDNSCDSIGMIESFYFSNMSPQTHRLNAGAWKRLEEYARAKAATFDSVLIWCGSVSLKSKKHIGKVRVPDYCWKIVYTRKTGAVEAYSFKNNKVKPIALSSYKVPLDSVEHLSGLKFVAAF